MSDDKPIALDAFEELAEAFSALAEAKPENAYYIEQPAIRSLLANISGTRILEAGCGPGILAKYLVSHGADVTGFDVSPKMVRLARERRPRAQIHVADLAKPLHFASSNDFDIVASSLAIDYVRDWKTPLTEFWRVLKPGGRLVFSVQHPLAAYLWYNPPTAFGVQYVEAAWTSFWGQPVVVPDYYRSIQEIINPVLEASFQIRRVIETKPVEALKSRDPEKYEKFNRLPSFLCIEAIKA